MQICRSIHSAPVYRPLVRRVSLLLALAACGGGGDGGPAPAARVDLSPSSVVLNVGGVTATVTASVKDASGGVLGSAPVSWTSDQPTIATVSSSGTTATVTAVAAGTATVRATSGTASGTVAITVLGVRSVVVAPGTASLRVGATQAFAATVTADPGISAAVTWSSDNPTILSVSSSGVATAVSIGATTLRATSVADPRVFATAAVTVTAQRSVSVTPNTATMVAGETRALVATVQIDAGLSTAVTWRSNATNATVSNAGVVTAVTAGSAVITAVSVADTTVRGTAAITIAPSVRSVAVTPSTATVFLGATQQYASVVTIDGAVSTVTTWRSTNPSIAAVSNTGLVTGVGVGTTTITAIATADTTKRATATVVVSSRPTTVGIVQRNLGINPGTSTTLTATVLADPGVSAAVSWTSSANNVASISSSGVLTGVTLGSTLITATSQADPTRRDTLTVHVRPLLAITWASTRLSGPLFEDIFSIVAFSASTAYAVNSVGDVFAWNGTAWSPALRGSTFATQFLAVHGSAGNNVIAVGTNGVIVRYDGVQWSGMSSGTTAQLNGVFVDAVGSGYAVGSNGTALRLTGGLWSPTTTGTNEALYGVWISGTTAIAVGASGTALRLAGGTQWASLNAPTSETLNAVSGTSPSNVVAVGSVGTVLRFDGTNWSIVGSNSFDGDHWAVLATNINNDRVFIAGDDGLLQLDGTTITAVNTPYVPRMFGLSRDASGILWTGGQRAVVQRNGGPGGAWETLNIAPDLIDVWSTSATNAWVVGEFGFIYRWNGTTWARQLAPTTNALGAVWAASSTDAFAGGDNGVMLRWNGSAWTSMSLPSSSNISGIWGTASNNVYATTESGEVLRFNGTTWTIMNVAAAPLWSVFGVSATEFYIGGEGGLVQRSNGTIFSAMPSPANGTLAGLWMTGADNVLVVGADATGNEQIAFRFDGVQWQSLQLSPSRVFTSVWGPSVTDVYVTGDGGTLLRFNGSSWSPIVTGINDLLWSISGAPDASGAAFAVGYNGSIVRGTSGNAPIMTAMSGRAIGSLEPSPAARRMRAPRSAVARAALREAVPSGVARRTRKHPGSVHAVLDTRGPAVANSPRRGR